MDRFFAYRSAQVFLWVLWAWVLCLLFFASGLDAVARVRLAVLLVTAYGAWRAGSARRRLERSMKKEGARK